MPSARTPRKHTPRRLYWNAINIDKEKPASSGKNRHDEDFGNLSYHGNLIYCSNLEGQSIELEPFLNPVETALVRHRGARHQDFF